MWLGNIYVEIVRYKLQANNKIKENINKMNKRYFLAISILFISSVSFGAEECKEEKMGNAETVIFCSKKKMTSNKKDRKEEKLNASYDVAFPDAVWYKK